MTPAEIAAAIRVCRRGPGVTIEPAPLLALADLAVAYLDARDRWERTGLDAEMLGAHTALDRSDAALRTAVGAMTQWVEDGEVTRVPPDPAADRRSPPAGTRERVLARITLQQRAVAAVKMANAALRTGLGYSPDRDIGPGVLEIATLAAGLLAAESNIELVALQRRAIEDDTLRAGVARLLAGDAPNGEVRCELQRLIGGAL